MTTPELYIYECVERSQSTLGRFQSALARLTTVILPFGFIYGPGSYSFVAKLLASVTSLLFLLEAIIDINFQLLALD